MEINAKVITLHIHCKLSVQLFTSADSFKRYCVTLERVFNSGFSLLADAVFYNVSSTNSATISVKTNIRFSAISL